MKTWRAKAAWCVNFLLAASLGVAFWLPWLFTQEEVFENTTAFWSGVATWIFHS
jgi:hypothetical protein